MRAGLIDLLNGRFLNDLKISEVGEDQQRVISIIDNLNRLFNTRRGSISNLPDYGLPDITEVYRELPYSIDGLRKAIKETVTKYEPRLQRVRVTHHDSDPFSMRLVFILSAELQRGKRVQFRTTFSSDELAQVMEGKQPR
jgi:type VI secretion system protein